MSINELQKQTNTNIQAKANLIWEIATHLAGLYKPHEYGKVILPMTILKRFDDALSKTKQAVLEMVEKLNVNKVEGQARDGILCKISGYTFYNTSKFDFEKLIADPDNIEANFDNYIKGFSDNIKDILVNFKFEQEIKTMSDGKVLFIVLQEFNSSKGEMSPDKITSADMGNIFEELIRKFSESYDEQAGAHFTSRDIIYLMTELLIAPEKDKIKLEGCTKTAYDMAMGTSQMLGCLTERLTDISAEADVTCFGQEFNPETYAIAKADMLIKGGNASGMMYGDTLSDDKFSGYHFDYIISNPPFGIDWKREKKEVESEAKQGYNGRFGAGLPAISDGQMLFMLNGIKKLKDGSGRMAIIQNGSSLFTGDAGSGASNIRKYVIEEDMLEAIIQLPTDLFYNTGISTYIWVITKGKDMNRSGKVQLIDASKCFIKRRKNIGSKRVDLDDACIDMIVKAYNEFDNKTYELDNLFLESKVFDNNYFGYTKVVVERPHRYKYTVTERILQKILDMINSYLKSFVHDSIYSLLVRNLSNSYLLETNLDNIKEKTVLAMATGYVILNSLLGSEFMSINELEQEFNNSPKNDKSKAHTWEKFNKLTGISLYMAEECPDADIAVDKNGNPIPNTALRDTEIIPLIEDIDEYISKNVLPYVPDAFLDRTKDKEGYEIPFTRLFYKFVPPIASDEIFAEIKQLEAEETALMRELFGNV